MDKQEVRDRFILNMERERQKLGYSQVDFAERLDMSLSGYKKIVNKETGSIPLYVAYCVHMLSGVPMMRLIGVENEDAAVLDAYHSLSPQQQRHIRAMMEMELELCSRKTAAFYCTLVTPVGAWEDGMDYDSCLRGQINVGEYGKRYEDRLAFALKITTNEFAPYYIEGDVLLIGNDRNPKVGEVGLYVREQRVYLRRFVSDSPMVLQPLCPCGREIRITGENIREWYKIGYVLKRMR